LTTPLLWMQRWWQHKYVGFKYTKTPPWPCAAYPASSWYCCHTDLCLIDGLAEWISCQHRRALMKVNKWMTLAWQVLISVPLCQQQSQLQRESIHKLPREAVLAVSHRKGLGTMKFAKMSMWMKKKICKTMTITAKITQTYGHWWRSEKKRLILQGHSGW